MRAGEKRWVGHRESAAAGRPGGKEPAPDRRWRRGGGLDQGNEYIQVPLEGKGGSARRALVWEAQRGLLPSAQRGGRALTSHDDTNSNRRKSYESAAPRTQGQGLLRTKSRTRFASARKKGKVRGERTEIRGNIPVKVAKDCRTRKSKKKGNEQPPGENRVSAPCTRMRWRSERTISSE